MAKTSSIIRNQRRIDLVAKKRQVRDELRAKAINMKLSDEDRDAARVAFQKLPRNSAKCRIRNRCQFTGRPRGVYRKFMISRIVFRELAHKGLIPGVTKASW